MKPGRSRLLSMMTAGTAAAISAAVPASGALRAEGAGSRIIAHSLGAAFFAHGLVPLVDGGKHFEAMTALRAFPRVQRHKRRLRIISI